MTEMEVKYRTNTAVAVPIEVRGGQPISRPIRKRAFWRAYERKALWCICSYKIFSMINQANHFAKVFADINCIDESYYIMWPR